MKPRLYIFNYNFEFNLAGRSPQTAKVGNLWWVLNRSVSWLAPLLRPQDAIYAIELPHPIVIKSLTKLLGFEPQFLVAPSKNTLLKVETSDMGQNLKASGVDVSGYELVYWGNKNKNAAILNSKQTSAKLRVELLPVCMQIPSLWLAYSRSFAAHFAGALKNFEDSHGPFLIKDPFGASGSYLWQGGEYSEKKGKQLIGMARQSGGLLLEKKMEAKAEWSLHFDFHEGGYCYQGMTELFCYDVGSYLGSEVRDSKALLGQIEALNPLLQAYVDLGASGPVGLDFLETKEGRFLLLEVNHRTTMGRLALEWQKRLEAKNLKVMNRRGTKEGKRTLEQREGETLRFMEEESHFWATYLYFEG